MVRTVQINTAIRIYDEYFKLSGRFTTQIFHIQLCGMQGGITALVQSLICLACLVRTQMTEDV